jgi:ATP-dependent Clp protease ATP-binding subunit ClpB
MDINRLTEKAQEALRAAQSEATRQGHQQIDIEHVLLAMVEDNSGAAGRILNELGLNRDKLMQALRQVRGSQRVTSQNPEATYEALECYGRDLTKLAAQGKLDPVIGRDDEIRRVIQVLSRRTKQPGVWRTSVEACDSEGTGNTHWPPPAEW